MAANTALNIAILGGGVAGPSCAAFLALAGHKVTIFERRPSPRKTGHAIDIRGAGVGAIRKLGLEDAIRAHHTTEKGAIKVDSDNKPIITLDATGDTKQQAFTSEFEILRSHLVNLLVDKAEEWGAHTVYGEYVKALKQDSTGVQVEYANGREAERFDVVVAADGAFSRTRSLLTGRPAREDLYRPCEEYCAYFTIPRVATDPPKHARLFTSTKGRALFIRPTGAEDEMGAIMLQVAPKTRQFAEVVEQGPDAQKALLSECFADAGWEVERVLKEMHNADDFYFQATDQVRMDKYAFERVALLGDAGYAVMGMGTSAAIYGGYILAGEITTSPNDVPAALQRYEAAMRPFADKIQKRFGFEWAAKLLNPQSRWGVGVLNSILSGVDKLQLIKLGMWVGSKMGGEDESIPEYEFRKREADRDADGLADGKL